MGELRSIWLLAPNTRPSKLPGLKNYWDFIQFQQELRKIFLEWGFTEAKTPTLVACPGTEPYIDVFSTEIVRGSRRRKVYLPTSPEIQLKKLIASEPRALFELKKVFRNNEDSPVHELEFTMLEWYRPFCNLSLIKADVMNLLRILTDQADLEFHIFTVAELFARHLNFSLSPATSAEDLRMLCQRLALNVRPDDSINDLFSAIWVDFVEPKLDPNVPTLVSDYPPFQAAYARLNTHAWAERFELFWKGFELANAFDELNDPQVQRQRMEADLELKRSLGKENVPLDEQFVELLQFGFPPTGGIALGVERLFMALNEISDIRTLHPLSLKAADDS